jgi:osmoprotectant transport system ATP-binding protein
MIDIKQVSCRFGDLLAVDGVSLTIPGGKIAAVVGASGSGKSTLLRMINRLVMPTTGTIRIDGIDTTTIAPEELRRRIGYVIQGHGLFPHWTVARNIATVPRLIGWDAARIDARVHELLDLFGLDFATYGRKLPHELSGGQQQRVGIARAIAAEPALLLMDEPFGSLDPISRGKAQDDIIALQRRLQITIIIVTHDMEEALRLADLIVVMDRARVVQVGPPVEILRHPAPGFVEQFVERGDRALKILSLTRVWEVVEPGAVDDKPMSGSASLRDAIAELLWRGVEALPVADTDGMVHGHVSFSAIVRRLRQLQ